MAKQGSLSSSFRLSFEEKMMSTLVCMLESCFVKTQRSIGNPACLLKDSYYFPLLFLPVRNVYVSIHEEKEW